MKHLNDFIQVVPALSKEECEHLISVFHQNFDKHLKHDTLDLRFTELNYNHCAPKEHITNLVKRLRLVIQSYVEDHGCGFFPQRYGIEEFRIKCYNDEGDCFRQHVDVGDLNSSRRFLAFLFYLNDDYKGGCTLFQTPDIELIEPKTGNCLVFPPTWQYPHEGKPLTCGTKYIMSTYLHYV